MSSQSVGRRGACLWFAILILIGVLAILVWWNQRRPSQTQEKQQEATPLEQPNLAARSTIPIPVVAPAGTASVASLGGSQTSQRPLPVAIESTNFQWAAADAKATNVIRQLAHNELEYQRMVDENQRIERRQLVYCKDTAAAIVERSRASGVSIKQLTLPGFDGQELQFTIDRADLEQSKQAGTFTGRLVNRPNSLVTLAFQLGREAFTVVSPEDGLYLQAFPREPGEMILTSFDPETYLALPGGEPIRTTNTFKIAQ